ncbi:hypothetical protein IFM89_022016 [Coptis chinensis]|uniref:Late embryogenesis abundant protein LEA-2 subgroup domain-containing protein n=1 Tax=Coptis chinensis TaxID=261450 RepID=A0A835M4F0_9MAGN|nr:hypothetical protein IFM89_022016 [Coptis chinensis]
MEERVSPPPKAKYEPPLFPSPSVYATDEPPLAPLPRRYVKDEPQLDEGNESQFLPTHDSQAGTYVVQVPRVQIYRVPPPENAILAERYRKPTQERRLCSSCFTKCFLLTLMIALVLIICGAIFYLVLRPQNPTFSIERVIVKNTHSKRQNRLEFYITLKADNPNAQMSIDYQIGGSTSLFYKKKEIAAGETASLHQDSKELKDFDLVLTGPSTKLPSEIEKSVSGLGKNRNIPLSLTVSIPMKLELGFIKLWSTKIAIECNMQVNRLSKGTRILDQKCDAKV